MAPTAEIDLYEVLQISQGAGKDEIRKAYRKLALIHHPDKVAESDRAEADIKFKEISQAYEILYDDEKREMYDTHGMSAFDPSNGGGVPQDMEEMLAQMFGMGGGMGGMGGMGGRSRKPRRSPDEEQGYEVTLEDLYKGKTVKFASTKNVICSHCKGKGAKESAKSKQCSSCKGQGSKNVIQQQGPFLTQSTVTCDNCQGTGSVFNEKDKCKKCKGKKVTSEKKKLELYIPHGAKHNERIVLSGEADQAPDQEPGDIVFVLQEQVHEVYERRDNDLRATVDITLAEALCGFSRVLIKTLDGRGLHVDHQKPSGGVLKPGSTIKIAGEGMPIKRTDAKGDLYLIVNVEFPSDDQLQDTTITASLQKLLPGPGPAITSDHIEEVSHEAREHISDFGGAPPDGDWEDDEDDDGPQTAQCAQQ